MDQERQVVRAFWLVTGLALIIRIVYLALHQPAPIENDAILYHEVARNLASGNGYTLDGSDWAGREPGYILFLALVYAIAGPEPTMVYLLQALLSAITCGILVFIGAAHQRLNAGAVAGAALAVWPSFLGYTDLVLTEVLTTFLICLFTLTLSRLIASPRPRHAVEAGVVGAALALTRSNFLILIIAIPIVLLVTRVNLRTAVRQGGIAAALAIVLFSTWVIRNSVVFDTFIPTRVGVGDILWSGSYVPWDGQWMGYQPPLTTLRKGLTPIEADDRLTREMIHNISRDPVGVAIVWLKKPPRILLRSDGSIYSRNPLEAKDWTLIAAIAQQLTWIVLVLTAACCAVRHRDEILVRVAVSLLLVSILSLVPGNPDPRYQIPLIPLVLLLSARPIDDLPASQSAARL